MKRDKAWIIVRESPDGVKKYFEPALIFILKISILEIFVNKLAGSANKDKG
jgi:hypothetical protein